MLKLAAVPEVKDSGLVALIMKSGNSKAAKVNVAVAVCVIPPRTPVMATA